MTCSAHPLVVLLTCPCRQAISDASWLLTANPFSVGDTITFNGAEWRVLRICLNTSTLQCLATGTPHTVLNSELRSHSTSLANKSRCSAFTAAVKQSIIGMPAAKLGSFMEVLQEAVAQQAAAQPALYRAGSSRVSVLGDRLVCNGTVDFMEAELLVEWQAACAGEQQHCCQLHETGMSHRLSLPGAVRGTRAHMYAYMSFCVLLVDAAATG